MITNWKGYDGVISLEQTGGSGATDCTILTCDAYAGTTTATVNGDSNSSSPYYLCEGDEIHIVGNGDFVPSVDLDDDDVSYDPGLILLAYSDLPTIMPPADFQDDPNYLGVASMNNGDWVIPNDINNNGGPFYFVPLTMYNMAEGTYSLFPADEGACFDLGEPIEVYFLQEIVTTAIEYCQTGKADVFINGGDPAENGTNFTISNLLPSTANLSSTTCANGGAITISGLEEGDSYSFDILDVNGCTQHFSGGPFPGTEDASFSYDSPFCQTDPNQSPTISGVSGGTFSASPAGLSLNANTGVINIGSSTPGTYAVTYKSPDPTCYGTEIETIVINPLPTVSITPVAALCVDADAVTLEGNPTGGTFSGPGINGDDFDPAAAGTGAHVITYDYSDGNGCENSATITINVNPLPTVSITPVAALCVDADAVTLVGSPTGGTFSGPGISGNDFDPAAAGTGAHVITYDYSDGNGCENSATITINVNPLPLATLNGAIDVCEDDPEPTIVFTGSNSVSPYTFTYEDPNGDSQTIISDNDGEAVIFVDTDQPGTYTYTLISVEDASTTTCLNPQTDVVNVLVKPLPEFTISASEEVVCLGANISLKASDVTNGDYYWEGPNGFTSSNQNPTINEVDHNAEGDYYLTVDKDGCQVSETIYLGVKACEIFIGEVVTPNGDGFNDSFIIENIDGFPGTEVWIYDRWGLEVYHNDNYANEWDGYSEAKTTIGNERLPEGTYYYLIKLGGDGPNKGDIYKGYLYLKKEKK